MAPLVIGTQGLVWFGLVSEMPIISSRFLHSTTSIISKPSLLSEAPICTITLKPSNRISRSTYSNRHNKSLPIVRCCTSNPSTEEKSPSTRIFVKGFSPSITEGFLAQTFAQFGEVEKVKIITDKKMRQSLGFAYVWFTSAASAELAVNEMDGKFFAGRFIAVIIAKPESPTSHVRKAYKF